MHRREHISSCQQLLQALSHFQHTSTSTNIRLQIYLITYQDGPKVLVMRSLSICARYVYKVTYMRVCVRGGGPLGERTRKVVENVKCELIKLMKLFALAERYGIRVGQKTNICFLVWYSEKICLIDTSKKASSNMSF